MSERIPDIQSAALNMQTAHSDCLSGLGAWHDEKWGDAKMWIGNAISQLESARAKIEAYEASHKPS